MGLVVLLGEHCEGERVDCWLGVCFGWFLNFGGSGVVWLIVPTQ